MDKVVILNVVLIVINCILLARQLGREPEEQAITKWLNKTDLADLVRDASRDSFEEKIRSMVNDHVYRKYDDWKVNRDITVIIDGIMNEKTKERIEGLSLEMANKFTNEHFDKAIKDGMTKRLGKTISEGLFNNNSYSIENNGGSNDY